MTLPPASPFRARVLKTMKLPRVIFALQTINSAFGFCPINVHRQYLSGVLPEKSAETLQSLLRVLLKVLQLCRIRGLLLEQQGWGVGRGRGLRGSVPDGRYAFCRYLQNVDPCWYGSSFVAATLGRRDGLLIPRICISTGLKTNKQTGFPS